MRLALTMCLLASTTLAQDRPLLTEEARTAKAGTLRFEFGGSYMLDEPNFLTGELRDTWAAPELRFTMSPSSNVEFDLEWVGFVGAEKDPTFGTESDTGDVSLRAKWRFTDSPAFAARSAVTLPQTSFGNGLGPNTFRWEGELLLTQEWESLVLHLNGGLFLYPEVLRPHEQRDFFAYGLAVEVPLGERVQLVAEAAGRIGDGAPGAEQRGEARLGLRAWLEGARLDVALRHGLQAADGTWGATAGITFIREGR